MMLLTWVWVCVAYEWKVECGCETMSEAIWGEGTKEIHVRRWLVRLAAKIIEIHVRRWLVEPVAKTIEIYVRWWLVESIAKTIEIHVRQWPVRLVAKTIRDICEVKTSGTSNRDNISTCEALCVGCLLGVYVVSGYGWMLDVYVVLKWGWLCRFHSLHTHTHLLSLTWEHLSFLLTELVVLFTKLSLLSFQVLHVDRLLVFFILIPK